MPLTNKKSILNIYFTFLSGTKIFIISLFIITNMLFCSLNIIWYLYFMLIYILKGVII